jgi:hypothetical protein
MWQIVLSFLFDKCACSFDKCTWSETGLSLEFDAVLNVYKMTKYVTAGPLSTKNALRKIIILLSWLILKLCGL